jgi:hypothetical protein
MEGNYMTSQQSLFRRLSIVKELILLYTEVSHQNHHHISDCLYTTDARFGQNIVTRV